MRAHSRGSCQGSRPSAGPARPSRAVAPAVAPPCAAWLGLTARQGPSRRRVVVDLVADGDPARALRARAHAQQQQQQCCCTCALSAFVWVKSSRAFGALSTYSASERATRLLLSEERRGLGGGRDGRCGCRAARASEAQSPTLRKPENAVRHRREARGDVGLSPLRRTT